jgi:hypothetical protein
MDGKMLRRLSVLISAGVVAASAIGAFGQTNVTVSNTVIGTTPMYLGFSQGDYVSNTNVSAWVDYSDANAFRIWSSPGDYPAEVSPDPSITTQNAFDSRQAALRADPNSSTYINWNKLNTDFAKSIKVGSNQEVLNYALGELNNRNIHVVEEISRNISNTEVTDWQGKWEQWQEFYAQAFYEAKNFNVSQFQIYNEPDDTSGETPSDLLVRLQVASDAIHDAIADVDSMYGKNLTASVAGPTSAGSSASSFATWGKPLLAGNRTNYEGNPTSYDLFNTYDFHMYSPNPSTFATNINYVESNVAANNASGNSMPVIITEFNYDTSADMATFNESLAMPKVYSSIGADLIGADSANVSGMYGFKFNQTPYNSTSQGTIPQPTGFYYLDSGNTDNVTGSTPAAEVYRLFTKAFSGARDRVSTSLPQTGGTYDMAADIDRTNGIYYAYASNTATSSQSVTMNLSNWGIQPGTLVTIEEVSARRDGEVSSIITVPSNGQISFSQPAQSVDLLTIPQGAPQRMTSITDSADAQVRYNPSVSGDKTTNYGSATTSDISRATSGDHNATYLKFSLAGQNLSAMKRAILEVTGQNTANSSTALIEVYGILNNSWNEATLDYANAPDISTTDSRMINVGTDAFPVGHLSFDGTLGTSMMDVTPFVTKYAASTISFVLVREQQFAAEADDGDLVSISTRESGANAPQLMLLSVPEPGVILASGVMISLLLQRPKRACIRSTGF